jgi:hypothetical protein
MNFRAPKKFIEIHCENGKNAKRICGPCISYTKFQIWQQIIMPQNFQLETQNKFECKIDDLTGPTVFP